MELGGPVGGGKRALAGGSGGGAVRESSLSVDVSASACVGSKRQPLIAGAQGQIEIVGGKEVPEHSHQYEDLFLYVLEGEFEMEVNAARQAAASGASLLLVRRTPYALRCLAGEPGRILVFP